MSFKQALDPEQCKDMSRFLNILLIGAEKAQKAGVKLDVNACISEFRGHTDSYEVRMKKKEAYRRQKELCTK